MPFLITQVVVLALVCGVNLVFTLGVVRRLREHTWLLNDERRRPRPNMGDVPAPFSATTTDGRTVSRESLPEFVRYAAAFPGGREHVLAVVNGPAEDVEESRERLAATAQVITDLPDAVPA
ncbi:hypothetical protein [Actinomadura rifamycini]|uniref:hypothetical protein n=1 Tax=Actinomadura rifamycini TaxID=31962 RepID=UPI0003FFC7BB|nr:hypothetical protein [Actinomadura rifamycini]